MCYIFGKQGLREYQVWYWEGVLRQSQYFRKSEASALQQHQQSESRKVRKSAVLPISLISFLHEHQDIVNICDEIWLWLMQKAQKQICNFRSTPFAKITNMRQNLWNQSKTYVGVRHLWISNMQTCDKKSAAKMRRKKDVVIVVALHCKEKGPKNLKIRRKYTIVGCCWFIRKSHITKESRQ